MSGITDPSEEFFKDGVWGWDGTVWRKLPLLFGYSSPHRQRVPDLNADAGTAYLTTTAVPAGEIQVIQAISTYDNTTALTRIKIQVAASAVYPELYYRNTFAIAEPAIWQGELVLAEGDTITVTFVGTAAGDDLYLDVVGYKMLIAA